AVLVYGRIVKSRGSVNLPVVILHITREYITRYKGHNRVSKLTRSFVSVMRGSSQFIIIVYY
ncbi:MAG: hypothetical protein ACP5RD_08265, partial [bacterium]